MKATVADPVRLVTTIRNWFRYIVISLIFIGLGFLTFRWITDPPNLTDVVLSLMGHDTVYAKGYSESGWRSLMRGMTTAAVKKTLGEPLKKTRYSKGRETWSYSKSRSDNGNHWKRNVKFNDNVLIGTYDRFSVD